MTQRITIKMIEQRLNYLNDLMGYAKEPYAGGRGEDGRLNVNAGNYHTYQAYGSCGICQMHETGGVQTIVGLGTKRECYDQLNAYIEGVLAVKHQS